MRSWHRVLLPVIIALASQALACDKTTLGGGGASGPVGGSGTGAAATDGGLGASGAATSGACVGTPTPCSLLAFECANTAGCSAAGSCTGVASDPVMTCGSLPSQAACMGTLGCSWTPSCSGVRSETCAAMTRASCGAVQGCSWSDSASATGSAGSGGGAGGGCATSQYQQSCLLATDCPCDLQCLQACATCPSRCAYPCTTDIECLDKKAGKLSVPICTTSDARYGGQCSAAR